MNLTFLGWLCTILFALCYIPQLLLTLRTKTVKDVSLGQWVIQLFGYMSGLGYGIWLGKAPLIFGYAWGMLTTLVYLALYFKYSKKENAHV